MSVIGTGTAAAVAQTALQAQQLARRRDREKTGSVDDARRLREMLEAHLRALEEGDQADTAAQLHIDGELHDRQDSPEQAERAQHHPDEQQLADEPVAGSSPDDADQSDPPLYRHLDIQA